MVVAFIGGNKNRLVVKLLPFRQLPFQPLNQEVFWEATQVGPHLKKHDCLHWRRMFTYHLRSDNSDAVT